MRRALQVDRNTRHKRLIAKGLEAIGSGGEKNVGIGPGMFCCRFHPLALVTPAVGHGNDTRPKGLIKRNTGGQRAKFIEQSHSTAILELPRLGITRMNVQRVVQMLGPF